MNYSLISRSDVYLRLIAHSFIWPTNRVKFEISLLGPEDPKSSP